MRITHIKITNLAAFEAFESDLPVIAIIQGKNGLGKTSLIGCLKYAFGRGHDPDIIHGDAEWGEILITFDNGAQVRARASRKSNETTRGWKAPGASKFTVGREQIDKIAAAISYDPLAFLDLDDKQQVETFLRIMPIDVKQEEIEEAVGDAAEEAAQAKLHAGMNPLEVVNSLRETIYGQRTDLNRDSRNLDGHVAQLRSALPEESPEGTDWTAVAGQRREALRQLELKETADLAGVKERFGKTKLVLGEETRQACAEVDADIDARIKFLERERTTRKQEKIDRQNAMVAQAQADSDASASEIRNATAPKRQQLTAELATAEERAKAQARAAGTKDAIEQATAQAETKRARAEVLTAAIDRLDALKVAVAARLPIKGISIADGRIVNSKGVPLRRWNTEAADRFCLRIGVLAHSEAGFLMLDNFEHFDQEKRRAMLTTCQKYAEKDGLQFLIASVNEVPLQIREPKPDSACPLCRDGIGFNEQGEHQTLFGPVECLTQPPDPQ